MVVNVPIEIKFLDDGIGVEFNVIGILTGTEIIDANRKIHNRANSLSLRYIIVDRTNCTEYLVNSKEIKVMANKAKKAVKVNPNIIIAMVSTTSLQHGMSRMYQSYIESSESYFKTAIFRDRKSAEEWIKEQLDKSNKNIKKKK